MTFRRFLPFPDYRDTLDSSNPTVLVIFSHWITCRYQPSLCVSVYF